MVFAIRLFGSLLVRANPALRVQVVSIAITAVLSLVRMQVQNSTAMRCRESVEIVQYVIPVNIQLDVAGVHQGYVTVAHNVLPGSTGWNVLEPQLDRVKSAKKTVALDFIEMDVSVFRQEAALLVPIVRSVSIWSGVTELRRVHASIARVVPRANTEMGAVERRGEIVQVAKLA